MSAEADPVDVSELLVTPRLEAQLSLLGRLGLANERGIGRVLERAAELVHDDPAAAENLCSLCDAAAGRSALLHLRARARYLRARVLAERGELESGLALIEQARQLWSSLGLHLEALRSALGRMQILDDLGRHADAVAVGERTLAGLAALPRGEAVDLDDENADRLRWLQAAIQENLGVAYGFLGEHESALKSYRESEGIYRVLGMDDETARPLANRGIELLALGRGREALAVLRSAAQVFESSGDRLWAAKCQGHVAQAHQQVGELLSALEVLEPARTIMEDLGAGTEAVRLQLAAADLYLSIGLTQEAAHEAAAAASSAEMVGMMHDTADATFLLAVATLESGELHQVGDQLQRARELFEQVGDRHQHARAALAQAELLRRQGRSDEALTMADAAAVTLRDGGWFVALFSAELWLADAVVDPVQAGAHLDEAGRLLEELRLPPLRVDYVVRRARQLRSQGRREEAVDMLHEAVEQVDTLVGSPSDHGLRRALFSHRLAAYDELVDLLVERNGPGDVDAALRLSDRAKARTLLDLIDGPLGSRVDARSTASTRDVEEEALHVDLNALYGELMSAADPGRLSSLRRRADELERTIQARRVRTVSKNATAAGKSSTSRATWPNWLLTYHVVGDDVIGFVSDHGATRSVRLPGTMPLVRAELDGLAAQWSRFRVGSGLTGRTEAALRRTTQDVLHTLHRVLVEPLVGGLGGPDGSPLVVVPPRSLLEVPFHALHDGSRPLLDRWSITVAPTAAGAIEGAPRPTSACALVLAVPDDRAPSVEAEAQAVARLLPGARVLMGESATTSQLFDAAPTADLIHIACHGLYRSGNPLFSSLRLGDRWMTATTILELDLRGALVVLSACESGRQGGVTAEPVGLAWAFLAAGASGVVVSQWVVDDESTTGLMTAFHRELVGGAGPAAALRHAQILTAASHPHPYYWAPFSYVASPAALRSEI